MADKASYLQNDTDTISSLRRMEKEGGRDLSGALVTVGLTATYLLARKKVNLSKAISSDVKLLFSKERGAYSRYLLTEVTKDKNATLLSRVRGNLQALFAPIPTGVEQMRLATDVLKRHGVGAIPSLPKVSLSDIQKHTPFRTYLKGPISAIAPGTPISMPGRRYTSGTAGGIVFGDKFYKMDKKGRVVEEIRGVRAGISGTSGERVEYGKAFGGREENYDFRSFLIKTRGPLESDIKLEQKRIFLEGLLRQRGISPINPSDKTSPSLLGSLIAQYNKEMSPILGNQFVPASQLISSNKALLSSSYDNVINEFVKRESAKRSSRIAFRSYRIQRKLGAGAPFTAYDVSDPAKIIRSMKEALGGSFKDPISGRAYGIPPARHMRENISLSGLWSEGQRGNYFLYQAGHEWKRGISRMVEGTFFKTAEQFGLGISTRHTKLTQFVSHLIGAKRGSYEDYFSRRYVGGFARLAALGYGGYTAFRLVDFLARQATGGWGITDVAGKLYTTAREFQQRVIDSVGLVDASKTAETSFPGIINSPLARLARGTAPIWMSLAGGKIKGEKGAKVGLALGIALALVTWGDITQSPEQLHRIYTGEQDVPVRKGRWWMFGKTPFGGGKVSYWRPHWYPLMRSKYKYQGQLWDSEAEELSSTGPFAPLLSPILTGKLYDPYRWEKEHYYDRPYPLTGEMFEPTMPFSWLLNATVGRVLKPQRIMHPEYWGSPQSEQRQRGTIEGAGASIGMGSLGRSPMLPNVSPTENRWLLTEGVYTLTEQMGLRGFLFSDIYEKLTGRTDFLPKGPVVQSARRATGYERSYWDMNLGDPAGVTEFIRRVIPHRRRGIEEYNPIPNTMPNWLPGEDYFINFRSGDPYTKVEMGEARLPGAGYESLHRLHSGIPGVYDAIDRFMILSDVAPYSNEYRQYAYLAMSMSKKDSYWNNKVKDKITQREKSQEEYEFLSLDPPDEVPLPLRPFSAIYRRTIAALGPGGVGGVIEPFIGPIIGRGPMKLIVPNMAFTSAPLSKFFPYRTATQTYKDFRLHGSEFTDWGNPFRDFIAPSVYKTIDLALQPFGADFIPQGEINRREYEEYFDRLQYVKSRKLESMARDAGNSRLASRFGSMASKTMTGVNHYMDMSKLRSSIPKRERAFLGSFIDAEGSERAQILNLVSDQMGDIYRAQWDMKDNSEVGRNDFDNSRNSETIEFFKSHTLPKNDWLGWHPEVDLKDTQLVVSRNEGMNIHNFDLWESQERSMDRRPVASDLGSIRGSSSNIEELKRQLSSQLETNGYTNARIVARQTPASQDRSTIRLKIRSNNDRTRMKLEESLIGA